VRRVLLREAVGLPDLIASYVRGMLLVLFSAMALTQLGVAREIVIIGFTVVFVTLAALTVIVVARSDKDILRRVGSRSRAPRG
jgi:hypothetical protein